MNDVLCATRNRQLNPSERRYITGSPQNAVRAALFHQDSSAATREAQRLWGTTRNMQTNGPGDAFRHAYWNALMTRRAGAQEAERFATAHEQTPGGNTDAARRMDLHNNAAGRRIAQANPNATPEQLSVLINNAYWRGELRTLPSSH